MEFTLDDDQQALADTAHTLGGIPTGWAQIKNAMYFTNENGVIHKLSETSGVFTKSTPTLTNGPTGNPAFCGVYQQRLLLALVMLIRLLLAARFAPTQLMLMMVS